MISLLFILPSFCQRPELFVLQCVGQDADLVVCASCQLIVRTMSGVTTHTFAVRSGEVTSAASM